MHYFKMHRILPVLLILYFDYAKGGIVEFGYMIRAMTNMSALSFNEYGNWCGLGGSGPTMDKIDECCQNHDLCYSVFDRHACPLRSGEILKAHMTSYRWKPLKTSNEIFLICNDTDPCKKLLCECDKMAASCFKDNLKAYNPKHQKQSGIDMKKILGFFI